MRVSQKSILTPKPRQLAGLYKPLIFNKSPLGDLGVDLMKESF
jgi:hypothetical protein